MRRRLATRTNNDYGKAKHELAGILDANATWEAAYRDRGASIIDATRPLDAVVADVLEAAES